MTDGNPITEGLMLMKQPSAVDMIKDEEIKKQFIGKRQNDTVDFDIRKAFPNDNEIAGLLKKKKEEVEDIDGNFRFTISEISQVPSCRDRTRNFSTGSMVKESSTPKRNS
ncbi:MAG: hypothetical protein MZV63_24670 [Marinilabiliales bacterium]|nr:hypothetical protein [Marinilabiliales bacterium]